MKPGRKPGTIAWNKGLTAETDARVKRNVEALKGKLTGRAKTEEAELERRRKISVNGKGKIGGYREHAGSSKKFYVEDSYGNRVCLQSSYELECSKILDKLSVKWIRPQALRYASKRYFADFQLVETGIYIDTKNDYLAVKDLAKIQQVMLENDVEVIILTKDLITEQHINSLVTHWQSVVLIRRE